MEKDNFRRWLEEHGVSHKVAGDHISRVRRIERELSNCLNKEVTIEKEYEKDGCEYVLSLFDKTGDNDQMNKLEGINLPVGKYHIACIKSSIKKYITYLESREK